MYISIHKYNILQYCLYEYNLNNLSTIILSILYSDILIQQAT